MRANRSGVCIPEGARFFSPQRPIQMWGLPSLIFNAYLGIFPSCRVDETWSWPLPSIFTPRLTLSAATSLCPRPCLYGVERGFYSFLSDIHIDTHVFSTRNTTQNQPFMGRTGMTCLWAGQLCKFDEAVPYGPTMYQQLTKEGWVVLVERYMALLKQKFSAKNLSHCHLVHHKSHVYYHGNKFLHR